MIVIDASATGALILDDERSPPDDIAETLATGSLIAPAHWTLEVANLILTAERRQRIAERQRRFLFERVRAMRVSLRRDGEQTIWEHGMALAAEYRLTIYDAVYLELAVRTEARLATLDTDLLAAARARDVPVLSWPSS